MQFDKWCITALAVMMILLLGCAKAGGKAPGYYLNGETLLVDLSVALKMDMELENKEKGGLLFTLPENYPAIPANTPFAITAVDTDRLWDNWIEHWGPESDANRVSIHLPEDYLPPWEEEAAVYPTETTDGKRRLSAHGGNCILWNRVEEPPNNKSGSDILCFHCDDGLPAGVYLSTFIFPVPIVVGRARAGSKAPGYYLNGETLLVDVPTAITMMIVIDGRQLGSPLMLPDNYPTIPANTSFFIDQFDPIGVSEKWKIMEDGDVGGISLPGEAFHKDCCLPRGVTATTGCVFEAIDAGDGTLSVVVEGYDPKQWHWTRIEDIEGNTRRYHYDQGLPAGIYVFPSSDLLVPLVVK